MQLRSGKTVGKTSRDSRVSTYSKQDNRKTAEEKKPWVVKAKKESDDIKKAFYPVLLSLLF